MFAFERPEPYDYDIARGRAMRRSRLRAVLQEQARLEERIAELLQEAEDDDE